MVKKRYRTLQLRYPPEQFIDKHIEWRPSFELLSIPRKRLNWFWQSGFVPLASSEQKYVEGSIWDKENAEPAITSREVLRRLCGVKQDYFHSINK